MKRTLLNFIILIISIGWSSSWAQTYVDAGATGTNDGSSWANAYTDLQQSIYDAQSGDSIWVNQGSYTPTIDETGSLPVSLRLRHFWLKDGVHVYGGFNGTEDEFIQRDVNTQKAILEGQVDASNKAYHVLIVTASNTAKLDGFIVQNGDSGTGASEGVSNSGGGLLLTGSASFYNIEFRNNIGYHSGGAVYASGSSSTFVNCSFENNSTTVYDGAALYADASSVLNLYNCVMYNNTAARFGGAIAESSSIINLRNLSIANNTGSNVYQAWGASSINHFQCAIWGNTASIGIDSGGGSSVNFTESIYQWTAAGSNVNADPLFVNIGTGDLRLSAGSPAIDGVPSTPNNPYRDLDGNYRVSGTSIDQGAYEYNSVYGQLLYVDVDAAGANNGTSWANAFNKLEDALAVGSFSQGEEIWIAEGTYTPHASDRSAEYNLTQDCKIYGGFNATESLRGQRNSNLNVVTLSGDLSNNDNAVILDTEPTRQDNSYHIIRLYSIGTGIIVDGVTISGANGNGTAGVDYSGAIVMNPGSNNTTSASFYNVIIENNTAIDAAVFNGFSGVSGSTVEINITHGIIRNNYCTTLSNMNFVGTKDNQWGVDVNNKVQGNLTNVLFHDNTSINTAACITDRVNGGFGSNANLFMNNCTFSNNNGVSGIVIYMVRATTSIFKNNIIYGNGSATPISWVNNGVIALVWQNCIVEDATFGLNQDPLFRDEANDDYRVDCSGNSPAINAGTLTGISLPAGDLNEDTRVIGIVDIGAYEYQNELEIIASEISVCSGGSVTLEAINATGISWDNGVTNNVPFIPVSTTTYTATGINDNQCADSKDIVITVTSINDENVSVLTTSMCNSGSTTVSIPNSTIGENYYLRDDSNNAIIDGPIAGTGNSLDFNTGTLTLTTTFNVYSEVVVSTNPALTFDGVNDYANLTADNRGLGDFMTITARVKTTPNGTTQFIAAKYNGINGFFLAIDAAGLASFGGRDGGGYKSSGLSTTMVADNEWHYLTGVARSTGWEIYVDGQLENSTPYTVSGGGLGSTSLLTLAAYSTYIAGFGIDDLSIWNFALSQAEIQTAQTTCLVGNETGLTGLFDFNDNAGTTALDKSNTAINASLIAITPATAWGLGGANGCSNTCSLQMTQTVTVNIGDAIAPVADNASLADATGACEVTSLTAPTATDDCAGSIMGTHNATFPITSNSTITWTYNDGNGNSSIQTQDVVIADNISPVANAGSLSDVTAQCEITSLTAPTATDNCAGSITGSHNATFPITSNSTVTWTYDDGSGNISTQAQNVVIADVTVPVANVGSLSDLTAQCSITSLTAPTATDNCVGTITGTHSTTLPITSNSSITWTYNDGSGNISTQTQNVVINDNIAPVANAGSLADLTAQCEIISLTAPTATDNCIGSVTGTHNATLPITSNTTITWTYNDGNGNTSTQSQDVVLIDITAPIADLGSLSTLNAQCEITSLTAPTATDNCIGSVTATHNATFPISNSSTITWTYDDGNGNTSTQTQAVVINDNIAPLADIASLTTINSQCAVNVLIAPTATDNCIGLVTGTHNATLPIGANTTVTWTYVDGNGNTSTQTQLVNVSDNLAPILDNPSLSNLTAECEITSLTAPTATDNCAGTITGTHNASLPITANSTITWTFDDGSGNTATQTQNVVINDITAPVADLPTLTDVIAQCEVTSLTDPTATDNCYGPITGTHNVTFPITTTLLVTWTYDDGDGNISTQTQNVIINDNMVPVADVPTLTDVIEQCEVTSLTSPTATDNCTGTITGTPDVTLPISTSTLITWTFDDGNGNISTQTQDVIISDNIAPVVDVANLVDVTEQCEVTTLTAPTATDNCLGAISGTPDVTFPITTNTLVTWTYNDGNGNTSIQTQQVYITDATAPLADIAALTDITAICEVTSLVAPTATDNCSGAITGTHNATLPITSTTTVTWTYTDANNNTTTQDQQVVITPVDATVIVSGITITANNSSADSYQWVDCANGNSPITGETGQSFTPTVNGNYAVEVTVGNCTETSACENITSVGLKDNEMISLNVYPNPTQSMLIIALNAEVEEVFIYDFKGSLVQQESSATFSVGHLADGVYQIVVIADKGIVRSRFVKE